MIFRRLFIGTLSCALLLLAPIPTEAWLKKLIKPLPPNDNLSDCKPNIQKRLSSLKQRSENIKFECSEGKVSRLCAPELESITKDWKVFIRKNSDLFGIFKNEIRFYTLKDSLNFVQTWQGIDISNTNLSVYSIPDKNYLLSCIAPNTIDTSTWKAINTTPKISSTTASETAISTWRTGDTLHRVEVNSIKLEIKHSSSTPKLHWRIDGSKYANNDSYWIYCILDANSGAPPEPKDCTTNTVGMEF